MMIFNSVTIANDLITIFELNDRTAVAFSCGQITLYIEGICSALSGKFLEKEL